MATALRGIKRLEIPNYLLLFYYYFH